MMRQFISISVLPAARRKGLARELLLNAEAWSAVHGAARMFLEVAVDNTAARALYASAGYDQVGTRRAYYLRPDGSRAS